MWRRPIDTKRFTLIPKGSMYQNCGTLKRPSTKLLSSHIHIHSNTTDHPMNSANGLMDITWYHTNGVLCLYGSKYLFIKIRYNPHYLIDSNQRAAIAMCTSSRESIPLPAIKSRKRPLVHVFLHTQSCILLLVFRLSSSTFSTPFARLSIA
jgi:hypothetical protein